MPFEYVCKDRLKRYANKFSDLFCLGEDGPGIFFSLVECCLNQTSIEEVNCESSPGPDVVLKLGRLPLDVMTSKCNMLLEDSFNDARQAGLFRLDDVVCVDYHDVVYHGKPLEYTVNSVKDGKKRRMFRYAVAGFARKKLFYTSRIRPCKTGDDTGDILTELLSDQNPGIVLMDRFFGGVKTFEAVEKLGGEYIIPCKHSDGMDELYKKSLLTKKPCQSHTIRKRVGGAKQVNVYFLEDKNFEYTSYYSNIVLQDDETGMILAWYKIRWNIENQFKKKKQVQPKTSSPNPSYRLLLETISYLLSNLWRLIVNTVQPATMKRLGRVINKILGKARNKSSSIRDKTVRDKTLSDPG